MYSTKEYSVPKLKEKQRIILMPLLETLFPNIDKRVPDISYEWNAYPIVWWRENTDTGEIIHVDRGRSKDSEMYQLTFEEALHRLTKKIKEETCSTQEE